MDVVKQHQFPTLLEFEELTEKSSAAAGSENIIPFREVPTNTVFKIITVKDVKVKERCAVIIDLQDQVGVTTKVWATSVLAKNLEEKREARKQKVLYIISKGKKLSANNRHYYDFEINAI